MAKMYYIDIEYIITRGVLLISLKQLCIYQWKSIEMFFPFSFLQIDRLRELKITRISYIKKGIRKGAQILRNIGWRMSSISNEIEKNSMST